MDLSVSDPAGSPSASEASPHPDAKDPSRPRWLAWTTILAAAVGAGLVAWLVGEATYGFFTPRLFEKHMPDGSTVFQPTFDSQRAADTRNAALIFGIQGCALALAMGLAGGIAGRSTARGLVVGLVAQAVGAVAGALASLALFPIIFRDLVPNPNDLTTPLLIQAGIWLGIGAVGGLALALGLRADRQHILGALYGGLLGAFLAAGLYRILHGILSPASNPTALVAIDPRSRLLAAFCLMGLVAVCAARGALGKADHLPTAPPAPAP